MKKLVSPLPWVGSKRQLRDSIIARIPDHTCYVEAFVGGAWVYLGKPPSQVEVLNDRNGHLINLYRIIKDRPDEFLDALWYRLPSRDLYAESKLLLKGKEQDSDLSELDRAVLFFYHIKNAFGARFGSGFAFSRSRPPRAVIGYDLLVALRERLQNTYIENLDFERVIKNYDSPETFFYLDPPYWMDSTGCYTFEFSPADHVRLRDALQQLRGKFLLSYGDRPEIRDLYSQFTIEESEPVTYTLSGKAKQKHELLISNY